jgi:hypothetical protein
LSKPLTELDFFRMTWLDAVSERPT